MKYNKNIEILEKLVAEHAFIIPIANHRYPDGTVNVDQFKENWEIRMKEFEQIPLWEQTPGFDDRDPLQREPYMVFLPAEESEEARGTILVAHGGGFSIRTGCEGPNIALYFHKLGYNTAILTYRLFPYTRMDCMADMQRAIRLLRARKEELHISDKVIVMGFSAGGMLSANCATHYDDGNSESEDVVERQSCRPDGAVIGYGAITGISFPRPFGMPDDFEGDLCGRDRKERLYLAPEKNIRYDSPPFFIWQTLSDDGRFGMNLAKELNDAGIPYELHIFEGGVHGLGMADGENDLGMDIPHITHWGTLCDEWMQMHELK
ncbi:MAG: alpha/beta hydrolase [Lachnospiraceae bacterium]|nr:alpha/beta hydrolase [Lachnospiraceae bacterium]